MKSVTFQANRLLLPTGQKKCIALEKPECDQQNASNKKQQSAAFTAASLSTNGGDGEATELNKW